jgi:hypothetical protein
MASIAYFITALVAFFLWGNTGSVLTDMYLLLGLYFTARGFAHIELTRAHRAQALEGQRSTT